MKLAEKQLWTVADFATAMGITVWQARELLRRLDEEMGGMLLRRSRGKNRRFTFFSATLLNAKPEIKERVMVLDERVAALEEWRHEIESWQSRVVAQVGSNTRDIQRLKTA